MSTLSRRDYFINLRKSYHVRINAHSASETLIFLPNENDKTAGTGNIINLIQLKSLIEADLNKIDLLLSKLEDKLEQYKFGLPTLLISGEQEIYNQTKSEIDSLCLKIRDHLEASFHKQNKQPVDQLKTNIGAHLANRLTEQFEKFQVFQKMFNSILYERVKNNGKKAVTTSQPATTTTTTTNTTAEMCLVLDEEQETMLQERSQEIDQVITDTLHVNDILNQIQVMTVQQGSLFDRIDVNLDLTRQNLSKTVQRLEKTAESFSIHQKRLILFFITLAIFVTFLLILHK